MDHLRQCRMRMANARQILGGGSELHRHDTLRDQLGSISADDMNTENFIGPVKLPWSRVW